MSAPEQTPRAGDSFSERRRYARLPSLGLSYVHLDQTNGGILLNLSDGGLAVQAAMSVMESALPSVRVQVGQSKAWVETGARVAWAADARRLVGIEFIDLPEEARKQLRDSLDPRAAVAPAPLPPPAESPQPSTLDSPAVLAEALPQKLNSPSRESTFDARHFPAESSAPAVLPIQPPAPPVVSPVPAALSMPASRAAYRTSYGPIVAVLAVLSLAAGWEAGRGNMLRILADWLESSAAAPVSSADDSLVRAPALPVLTSFVVADSANQSWLVPFAAPAAAPSLAPSPEAPALPSAPGPQSGTSPLRLYIRSSPAPAARAAAPMEPPVVASAAVAAPAVSGIVALAPPAPPLSVPDSATLTPARLSHRVDPVYPSEAARQSLEGTVVLRAHVSQTGSVSRVSVISGSPMLSPAAVAAVRKWRYSPALLNGHPVDSDLNVGVDFTLAPTPR